MNSPNTFSGYQKFVVAVLAFLHVAGGVAAAIAGLIVVQTNSGSLRHFDILGYILVGTTLITLTMMYLINRSIEGARAAVLKLGSQTQAGVALTE